MLGSPSPSSSITCSCIFSINRTMKIEVGWCPSDHTLPRPYFQIGGNTNLFDWTYIRNVTYAHMLAADKLVLQPPSTLDVITQALDTTLPSIDLTTGHHHVPTVERV
jgi:3-beta hydroxysteroid dehydrogenase/isomerase family